MEIGHPNHHLNLVNTLSLCTIMLSIFACRQAPSILHEGPSNYHNDGILREKDRFLIHVVVCLQSNVSPCSIHTACLITYLTLPLRRPSSPAPSQQTMNSSALSVIFCLLVVFMTMANALDDTTPTTMDATTPTMMDATTPTETEPDMAVEEPKKNLRRLSNYGYYGYYPGFRGYGFGY
jgi:hypothetical protein